MKTKQAIYRLYQYRDALKRLKVLGADKTFSRELADIVEATSVQVRKDFSLFGISGNKRGGYSIDDLLSQIDRFLNKDSDLRAIVVGAGNIGRALINYKAFVQEGIQILAAFDIDKKKQRKGKNIPILPLREIEQFIKANKVKIGILAVPDIVAQETLDLLIKNGIKGVLNFAPVALKPKKKIFINNMNVGLELETVGYFVNNL